MLSKARRLNSEEVESVMKKGRRIASSFFSLSFIPSPSGTLSQCAVIIPKKVAKTSVLRHKHKRRIAAQLTKLILPQGQSIIMLRSDISKLTAVEVKNELEDLLAKAR